MEEVTYRKVMKGKRTTYEAIVPVVEEVVDYNLSEAEALTAAGALGVTLLHLFERHIPPHKRVARNIRAVHDAVLGLYQGNGNKIKPEVADTFCKAWDLAMKLIATEGV